MKQNIEHDNMVCRCGHIHKNHGISNSINYTAGKCSECDCKNFVIVNSPRKIRKERELLIAYEIKTRCCTDSQAETMVDSYLAITNKAIVNNIIETKTYTLLKMTNDPLKRDNMIWMETKEGEGTGIDLDQLLFP